MTSSARPKRLTERALIEITSHPEFDFANGDAADDRIADVDVDSKYAMHGCWSLPPEVIGHLALPVTADDAAATWRASLMRLEERWLNPGRNRVAKATLSCIGRGQIRWLWRHDRQMARNRFLNVPAGLRGGRRNGFDGQARVNELFRLVHSKIVRRPELATVAQQHDFMKRARGNGGPRSHLRPEGILVLGHQENDSRGAAASGLSVPKKGEPVATRVMPASADDECPIAEIDGQARNVARQGDPLTPATLIGKGEL